MSGHKFAIIDPAAGISGDMLLGALIDAGAPPAWLTGLPERLGVPGVTVEIVGGIEGFEQLEVETVYSLPAALGSGWVSAAHGALPVPAPATGLLLEGMEVAAGGPVTGEATTPTGAVLLRVLSSGPPPARWRARRSGWGAGT